MADLAEPPQPQRPEGSAERSLPVLLLLMTGSGGAAWMAASWGEREIERAEPFTTCSARGPRSRRSEF